MKNAHSKTKVIFHLLILLLLHVFCLSALPQGEPKSLKDIYKTGKVEFVRELTIDSDSFPDDVYSKLVIDLAIWKRYIYLADPMLCDIKVLTTAGKFQTKFGQKGRGPSDLYRPFHMAFSGDKLVVWENPAQRFSVFDSHGKFIKNVKPQRFTGRVAKIRSLEDGRVIVGRDLSGVVKGKMEEYFGLELYSKDMEFIKILFKKPISRREYFPKAKRYVYKPFSPHTTWDVLPGNKLVLGHSGTYTLEIIDPTTGQSRTFTHPYKQVKVSETDKEIFFNGIVSSGKDFKAKKGASEFTRKNTTFPEYKPAFVRIMTDYDGNILVLLFKKMKGSKAIYFDAFDREGTFINQVEIVSKEGLHFYKSLPAAENTFWFVRTEDGIDYEIARYKVKSH